MVTGIPMPERPRLVRRFLHGTNGSVTVDVVVMVAGLAGFGLVLLASVGTGVEAASQATNSALRREVVARGFDASSCPADWQVTHAQNTGLSVATLHEWYGQEGRATPDAMVVATLRAHADVPQDFRFQDPMTLAHLQIMMCLADDRRLAIP
jgi:hypothetical protein